MSDVKPILGEDTIFGRFYYRDTDYAALEAELAELKGEYEWVASINTALDESNQSAWAENAKLRAELERLAVDEWKLVPVEPTLEMLDAAKEQADCMGDWYRAMLAAAPSPPLTISTADIQSPLNKD